MLAFLTIVFMGILAYAYFVEGIFTAFLMCCNVIGAGLIAFNFWEPIAKHLPLGGYEDALCLMGLFCIALASLRAVTNGLASSDIEFIPQVKLIGGALFGLITGYLAAGFLVCVLQTLPGHQNFMSFDYRVDEEADGIRRLLPADRVWLAMMHRASTHGFSKPNSEGFDPYGSFELRYARFRRYPDGGDPPFHNGEFDPVMRERSRTTPAP